MKTSWTVVGLPAWPAEAPSGPTSSSVFGVDGPGVDEEPGQPYAVHVGDPQCGDAVVRDEGGVAEAEHDGPGALDLDGLVQVVDAGRQQQVEALAQCLVDGRRRRPLLDDVELAQRQRLTARGAVPPRHARGVAAQFGQEDAVVVRAPVAQVQERLLAGEGRGGQGGVGRLGEALARGALDAGEDHVPHGVEPAAHGAVAGVPLLLGVGADAAVDPAVRDVAAAGPAVAVGREVEAAANVHPAERRGLRDGPAVGAVDGGEGEVLRGAPEVLRGVAVEPAGVHGHIAVDRGVVGREAEARDGGVEAELGVEAAVGAGAEEEGVAAGAELRGLLLAEDLVQLALDAGRGGVEDDDVRAEVAAAGDGARPAGGGFRGRLAGGERQRGDGARGGQRPEDRAPCGSGAAPVRGGRDGCGGCGHGNSPGLPDSWFRK